MFYPLFLYLLCFLKNHNVYVTALPSHGGNKLSMNEKGPLTDIFPYHKKLCDVLFFKSIVCGNSVTGVKIYVGWMESREP